MTSRKILEYNLRKKYDNMIFRLYISHVRSIIHELELASISEKINDYYLFVILNVASLQKSLLYKNENKVKRPLLYIFFRRC